MAWTYQQVDGRLRDKEGRTQAIGYSGAPPEGFNNPLMQSVPKVGPIPVGLYYLTAPEQGPTSQAMRLIPDPANNMHGRSGFWIHGDLKDRPGYASEGCIILPRTVRESIWASGDHTLRVIVGE